MKRLMLIGVVLVTCIISLGWFGYNKKALKVYGEIKNGSNKEVFMDACSELKFLRKQELGLYPNHSEEEMRYHYKVDRPALELSPANYFNYASFGGQVEVYNYLIKKKSIWPNGWTLEYMAIFYNKETNKVEAKGKYKTVIGQPKGWEKEWGILF